MPRDHDVWSEGRCPCARVTPHGHGDRSAVLVGAVSDLTREVLTPTACSARGGDGADVSTARSEVGHARVQVEHRLGCGAIDPGAVTKLSSVVGSPATDRSGWCARAGEAEAGFHRADAAREVDDRRRRSGRDLVTGAELPAAVATPAEDARLPDGGTGVVITDGDIDGPVGKTLDSRRDQPVVRGAVPELATVVTTPALHAPILEHGAGRAGATRNTGDRLAEAHDIGGNVPFPGRTVAQLPIPVLTPALDSTLGGHSARRVTGCRDGDDLAVEPVNLDWVVAALGGAVAQLSSAVVSPAPHSARGAQRTAVRPSGRDGLHAAVQPAEGGGLHVDVVHTFAPALDRTLRGQRARGSRSSTDGHDGRRRLAGCDDWGGGYREG